MDIEVHLNERSIILYGLSEKEAVMMVTHFVAISGQLTPEPIVMKKDVSSFETETVKGDYLTITYI